MLQKQVLTLSSPYLHICSITWSTPNPLIGIPLEELWRWNKTWRKWCLAQNQTLNSLWQLHIHATHYEWGYITITVTLSNLETPKQKETCRLFNRIQQNCFSGTTTQSLAFTAILGSRWGESQLNMQNSIKQKPGLYLLDQVTGIWCQVRWKNQLPFEDFVNCFLTIFSRERRLQVRGTIYASQRTQYRLWKGGLPGSPSNCRMGMNSKGKNAAWNLGYNPNSKPSWE